MRRLFRFDEPPAEYELLETESGEPSFFWRMAHAGSRRAGRPGQRTRNPVCQQQSDDNLEHLQQEYRSDINKDIIMRRFSMGGQVRAAVVFFDGMPTRIRSTTLFEAGHAPGCMRGATQPPARHAVEHVIAMQDATVIQDWGEVKTAIGDGTVRRVFRWRRPCSGHGHAPAFPGRNVTEPKNETVILGPHEAFTENIRVNISLLRKIIKTDDFVCEFRPSGGRNNVRIAIAYREGTANPGLVNEVKRRLATVDTLKVLSIATLEQLTEVHP